MRRNTQTKQASLFDQVISGQNNDDEKEQQIKVSVKNQSQQAVQHTKSLLNNNDIFYSQMMDFKDFKQSLRYNNKNLRKIALESMNNPHPKIVRNLTKYDLSGLLELKLNNIDINDSKFEIFKGKGGIEKQFPKLILLTLRCPKLTSTSLQYLFQGTQQRIQYLDLGNTQIDNQGLYYISQLQWLQLITLILEWCSKIDDLNCIGNNSDNFPNLITLDTKFLNTQNYSYENILNSKLGLTLSLIRVFGTNVDLQQTQWKSTALLNLFTDQIRGNKIQEIKICNEKACDRTKNLNQVRIQTDITAEKEKKKINLSWKIEQSKVHLQFVECAEQLNIRINNYGKLFEFLSKEWQLRNSLKSLILIIDEIQADQQNLDVILNTINNFQELKKLKFYLKNQIQLKPINYFYSIQQITNLHNLLYLQVYKIQIYLLVRFFKQQF